MEPTKNTEVEAEPQSGITPLDTLSLGESEDYDADERTELKEILGTREHQLKVEVYNCPVDHQGTSIYIKAWTWPGNQKQPIVIVHGLRENVGVYRETTKALVAAGYDVFGFDLRGHGRSGTMLGHIPNFDSLVNDLLQVIAWVRFKSDRRLPVIISQGIGSLVAMHFQRKYPQHCSAIVMAAPCLIGKTSWFSLLLLRATAEMMPKMRLPSRLTPKFMAAYHHGGKQRVNTPLLRWGLYGITANFVSELMRAVSLTGDFFNEYSCKTLMLFPSDDIFYDYKELQQMIAKHPTKELFSVQEITGGAHHVLSGKNEDLNAALSMILPWLEELPSSETGTHL